MGLSLLFGVQRFSREHVSSQNHQQTRDRLLRELSPARATQAPKGAEASYPRVSRLDLQRLDPQWLSGWAGSKSVGQRPSTLDPQGFEHQVLDPQRFDLQ